MWCIPVEGRCTEGAGVRTANGNSASVGVSRIGENRLDDECEPGLSIAIVNILVGKKTQGESLLGQC